MIDPATAAVILGMSLTTLATRLAGPLLVRWRRPGARLQQALDAAPGAVLIGLIAPGIVAGGPAHLAGAAIALLLAQRLPLPLVLVAAAAGAVLLRRLAA